MNEKLKNMLKEWNDILGDRTMSEAEDLINELQIEISGKESLIEALKDDLVELKT